jgi:dTMP kinase
MAERGMLITFEGPDGAGKTTQIRMTAEALRLQGVDPLCTREPGGTRLSEAIRGLLLDPCFQEMDPLAEALLYAAARAQLVAEVILPALQAGRVVLCDRFVDSSLAYQGYGRGLDLKLLAGINSGALEQIGPFGTVVLDLPVELGLQRVRSAGKPDRLEQEAVDFHRRVRQGFLSLARNNPQRIRVIDAAAPASAIQAAVWGAVQDFLAGKQGAAFQILPA